MLTREQIELLDTLADAADGENVGDFIIERCTKEPSFMKTVLETLALGIRKYAQPLEKPLVPAPAGWALPTDEKRIVRRICSMFDRLIKTDPLIQESIAKAFNSALLVEKLKQGEGVEYRLVKLLDSYNASQWIFTQVASDKTSISEPLRPAFFKKPM